MKSLISAVLVTCLTLGTAVANAASVAAADAGMVQTATFAGGLAGIDKAFLKAAQMVDLGGSSNVLWVLGGGLVALSLVARRKSG